MTQESVASQNIDGAAVTETPKGLEDEVWQNIVVPSVAKSFGVNPGQINRTNTFNDYNADSIETLELALDLSDAVEARYGLNNFPVPNDIDPAPRNLGELCSYLTGRITEGQTSK